MMAGQGAANDAVLGIEPKSSIVVKKGGLSLPLFVTGRYFAALLRALVVRASGTATGSGAAIDALRRSDVIYSRCLTPSRSSSSSAKVLAISSFEKASISKPSTSLYSPFSVVTGRPKTMSSGTP